MAYGIEVCIVPELGKEGFVCLPSIVVLPAVIDPVCEALYAASDRNEEGRYGRAAMAKVEATTARMLSCPVRAKNTP